MFQWLRNLIQDSKNRHDFREASRSLFESHGGDLEEMVASFKRAHCKVARMSNGFYLVTTPAGVQVLLRPDAIVLNPVDKDFR